MTTRQKLVAVLAAAAAALAFGCTSAPTISTQAPLASQDQGSTLPPDQVLKDARHIMVAGTPMSFDQIAAQLPETLTPEQASTLLVNIPQSAVSTQNPASFKVQGLGGFGGYGGYYFNRGFYGGFGGFYGGCLYYPYASYYFPYTFYGGLYHRYYGGGYYPFFYGYRGCYYPYYYNRFGRYY